MRRVDSRSSTLHPGSSANPGFRDIAIVAEIMKGRKAHERVSLDINPASRQILECLLKSGHLATLIRAGARLHQAGCNGCAAEVVQGRGEGGGRRLGHGKSKVLRGASGAGWSPMFSAPPVDA